MDQEWVRVEDRVWKCGERYYVSLLPSVENFRTGKQATRDTRSSIRIHADTHAALQAIAQEGNVSFSFLVDRVLDDFVKAVLSGKNEPESDDRFLWRDSLWKESLH